jgi:drug/metabolite transporter (DMT)-like permease
MKTSATVHQRGHLLPSLAVAAVGAAWGGYWYPIRQFEMMGVGGAWISFAFFALTALGPLPWLLRDRAWRPDLPEQMLTGLLLGAAFSLYTVSLVMTDVVHAILLFYLTPVWSTLGGLLWLRERLTAARALAMVLGFGGVVCILGLDDGLPLPRNAGDWMALLSGLLWAAGTMRSFARPAEGIALPVFAFAAGGVLFSGLFLLLTMAIGHSLAASGGLAPALPWLALMAFTVILPSNYLVLWAAQRIDSGRVGILLMTEVLAGAVTAALFSGEPFGMGELAGTILIICAALIEISGRR